ncbi:protein rolling stone [Aplysia californica]|uniref:Protein rolling stone n=1 Tax=Aplysia californica TaxID=6500 RepID=A0ABM1AD23_APLCA|nr:protein rolling stone [Aplysia californica]
METGLKPGAPEEEEANDCTGWCLTEFQSESINLDHDRPPDFVTSQWAGRPRVYVIYRALVGLVLLGWVSGDIIYESREFYEGQAWRWLFFASNWSFALLAFTAVVQAATTALYAVKPYWIVDPIYIRAMPLVLKFQWVLFNVSSNSAIVVTTAYWAFIAFVSNAPLLTSDMSRLKHTVNTLYVLADVMLGATPIRVYHLFFSVFLGSFYTVFNALYYINNGSLLTQTGVALDGRDYYFMNWTQPVEAVCTCVLGVMLSVAAQFVLHALYRLRHWLHGRLQPGHTGLDAELENIVTASASYNSLEEAYGGRGP